MLRWPLSGSEEVDPTRLMSLEAVQLLREVDEETGESKGRPQLKKNVFFRALPESPNPPP